MLESYSHFHYENYEKKTIRKLIKSDSKSVMSRFYFYTRLRKYTKLKLSNLRCT